MRLGGFPEMKNYGAPKEFSAQTVRKLAEERNSIMDVIYENRDAIEAAGQSPEAWMDDVERWLVENMGGKSWDVRELVAYRLEIEQRIRKSGPNQWLQGDSRVDGQNRSAYFCCFA